MSTQNTLTYAEAIADLAAAIDASGHNCTYASQERTIVAAIRNVKKAYRAARRPGWIYG